MPTANSPMQSDDVVARLRELYADERQKMLAMEKFMWQVRDTCVRAEKAEAEIASLSKMLGELLAVIHRDGGHKQNKVGTEQAWQEAMSLSSDRIVEHEEIASLKEQVERKDAAIRTIGVKLMAIEDTVPIAKEAQRIARNALGDTGS
jgi:hypothetical protein